MPPTSPDDATAPDFDARDFARRWKDVWSGDIEPLEARGARQKHIIERAPQAWLRALVRELPVQTVWAFLNPKPNDFDPARAEARHLALRGFQQTASVLKNPTIHNRLVAWLDKHREVAHVWLLLWEGAPGAQAPDALRELDEGADDAQLLRALGRCGANRCWLGAALLGSDALFERIEAVLSRPEALNDESIANEVEAPPDEAGQWRERVQRLEAELEIKTREVRLAGEQNAELETMRERLRASSRDIERLKKEERQRETAATKKLELAQQAAAAQLAELKKHDERESRRLSAAEKERDELDSTVKVLRRQVRHLNQLLDEQSKKIASLQAELEANSARPAGNAGDVDAVSTPQTSQKTADAPVKVARPTPLDELFRWMADGHEFRATPRETMRCIDRGDEAFTFRAQLALDGIAAQDIGKKSAFLARLREQDRYYVRVLTEPTQRALVDTSNVVRATKNRYGKGELRNLRDLKRELRRLGFFPIEMIADASLRHNVDEINAYNEMVNRGEIEVVTPGTEADEVLARKARNGGGYVVTNDARFHFKVSPDLAPPSISFRVHMGTVIVDNF